MNFASFVIKAFPLSVSTGANPIQCSSTSTCGSAAVCMSTQLCSKGEVLNSSASCSGGGSYIKYDDATAGYCFTESSNGLSCDEMTTSCSNGGYCHLGMCVQPCNDSLSCSAGTCSVHVYCPAGITEYTECSADVSETTGKYTQYLPWSGLTTDEKTEFEFGYCAISETKTDECSSQTTCAKTAETEPAQECDQDHQCVMRCSDGNPCADGYVCAEPSYCNRMSNGECTRYLSELEVQTDVLLMYTMSDSLRSLCVNNDQIEGDTCDGHSLACGDNLACNLGTNQCEKLNVDCDVNTMCPLGRSCRRVAECNADTFTECNFITSDVTATGPLLYVDVNGDDKGLCMTEDVRTCNEHNNSCPGDQFCVSGVCETVTCNGWLGCSRAGELCMNVKSCDAVLENCTDDIPADLSGSVLVHEKAGFEDVGRCFTTGGLYSQCDGKSMSCEHGLQCFNGMCQVVTV